MKMDSKRIALRHALRFINSKISEQLIGHFMYIDPQNDEKEYHYILTSELTKKDKIAVYVKINDEPKVEICTVQFNYDLKKYTIKIKNFDEFDEDSVVVLLNVLKTVKSAIDSYRLSNPTSSQVTIQ